MQAWDVDAADVAVASLARHAGATEVFNLFCRYAGRDFRSIGHKAIYVANSFRTLQCIGWQHAETGVAVVGLRSAEPHRRAEPS